MKNSTIKITRKRASLIRLRLLQASPALGTWGSVSVVGGVVTALLSPRIAPTTSMKLFLLRFFSSRSLSFSVRSAPISPEFRAVSDALELPPVASVLCLAPFSPLLLSNLTLVSRLNTPAMPAIPGIPCIPAPFLGVEREILLANRWKFWDEIRFLLPSASGVGDEVEAPVGSGVDTRGGVAVVSNVMDVGRRIWACEPLSIERESSVLGNAIGAGAEDAGNANAAVAPDEVGNATGSGSSDAAGKETGDGMSLVGTDGATLSALILAVGFIDGARIEAVGARTEGTRTEAVTTRGDSETNTSVASPI